MGGGKMMMRKSFARLITAIVVILCVIPLFELACAQEPAQMTLEGGFQVTHTATGDCMVCVPPASSGTIKLVVDFATGSVSGELSGGGAGQASTYLCDESGQPTDQQGTAEGTTSYSGSISGSVDPQSGAISANSSLQVSGTVAWVSGCPDCPTEKDDWTSGATITGMVTKDGSASGQIHWGQLCSVGGSWNAQAASIVYPPSPTPPPQPTETPTPEPTETPAPEPTETPTREPTETPTPEPTETPTLVPTETSTPEPKGALPTSDDQDRDETPDLVRNLEQLLAGQGVKGPTPGQAAAGAVAVSILSAIWGLANLLSGGSKAPPDTPERPTTSPEDRFGPLPSADPDLIRLLQTNFQHSVQQLIDEGHYVMNTNFVRKSWNWTIGGVANWVRGYQGGQCEEFADLGSKQAEVFAERLFGEGVIVDTLLVEERSSAAQPDLASKIDSLITANHVATRVILPTGERYILDYWKAVGDGQSDLVGDLAYRIRFGDPRPTHRPRLIPEHEWAQKWRQNIGMDDSYLVTSNDQTTLKKDIEHYLDLHRRGGYGVKSEEEALQKAFDQFRRTNSNVADTLINSWRRKPW